MLWMLAYHNVLRWTKKPFRLSWKQMKLHQRIEKNHKWSWHCYFFLYIKAPTKKLKLTACLKLKCSKWHRCNHWKLAKCKYSSFIHFCLLFIMDISILHNDSLNCNLSDLVLRWISHQNSIGKVFICSTQKIWKMPTKL